MNKTILSLLVIAIGLSAQADYTVQTVEPLYPNQMTQPQNYTNIQPYQQNPQYQQGQPYQPYQNYNQTYNQGYYQDPYQTQNPYQGQVQNPYLGQYPNQYNPYSNPYGYGNNNLQSTIVNSAMSGLGRTNGVAGGASSIMRNIVQSVIYSKLRGF